MPERHAEATVALSCQRPDLGTIGAFETMVRVTVEACEGLSRCWEVTVKLSAFKRGAGDKGLTCQCLQVVDLGFRVK
jgi:hypothetical protein